MCLTASVECSCYVCLESETFAVDVFACDGAKTLQSWLKHEQAVILYKQLVQSPWPTVHCLQEAAGLVGSHFACALCGLADDHDPAGLASDGA